MKFQFKSGNLESLRGDCLAIGVFEGGELTSEGTKLDQISKRALSKILKNADFSAKPGETLFLYSVPQIHAERVLLVGCGNKKTLSQRHFRKAVFNCMRALRGTTIGEITLFFSNLDVEGQNLDWKIKQIAELSHEAMYSFDQYKTNKKDSKVNLKQITLFLENKNKQKEAEAALKIGEAVANGIFFTKNLANQPSNVCTPSYLAQEAKVLAKSYSNIKIKILEEKEMQRLGMGAFLAVAQGSEKPAKLITLEYHGTKGKAPTIALVGKGITFDTGGISLKPADSMVGMKYDMCGAATVLGVFKSIAEMKLPVHLIGVMPCAENMPSGTACKPEDIVRTMSGQTVEIMNTDAEGRLILSDALTYCERFKPDAVIDIATLTGAVVIALGHHATGLLSNQDKLANELLQAGEETYDRAWRMPLWDEYQEQLNSPFADMSNVGGRSAGTITAACFLSRFAKKFAWAHLDVAGTAAMMGGNDRYATGRPVPLLTQFLINRCNKKK